MDVHPGQAGRACHECNRKKTKCDMKRPGCGLCTRTDAPCTYPSKRKAPSSRPASVSKTQRLDDSARRLLELLSANPQLATCLTDKAAHDNEDTSTARISRDASADRQPDSATIGETRWETSAHADPQCPSPTPNCNTSYSTAMHLIDLFFERIQPWLPLLHRPRFQKYYSEKLRDGTDCLDDLPIDEALLLSSLFALAARFSSLGSLANVPAARRGDRYAALSKKLYSDCRTCGLGTLAYLQGCILLAFYSYCSGLSQQGWILVGVCVRVAYDLGLSDLDGPDSQMPSRSWVQQEELRRAWWLVWELDTFGSSVKQRPYAVDRRRITVLLPVSDEAWFSETETPSSRLITRYGHSWKSLVGSENQDARAWFLVANHLLSLALDGLHQEDGISADEKLALENDITCLRFSLPGTFSLEDNCLGFEPSCYAQSNWVIGTHLLLEGTASFAQSIGKGLRSGTGGPDARYRTVQLEASKLSQIARCWSPNYVALAHPFWVFALLPIHLQGSESPTTPSIHSKDLISILLDRFARSWCLCSEALRICDILANLGEISPQNLELVRRYPIFFPKALVNRDIMPSLATPPQQNQENSSPGTSQFPDMTNDFHQTTSGTLAASGAQDSTGISAFPALEHDATGFAFEFESNHGAVGLDLLQVSHDSMECGIFT